MKKFDATSTLQLKEILEKEKASLDALDLGFDIAVSSDQLMTLMTIRSNQARKVNNLQKMISNCRNGRPVMGEPEPHEFRTQ
jgi:hypothetical protein